ncbi:MAG: bifunctional demethylmenaquinone methyltransferase/2-methoxy-6-polyprenyl,4-benzoquinol methylase, partial [Bacteroidota bacterium]
LMAIPYQHLQANKKEQVRQMFNNIAPKYDLLNNLLSAGVDKLWRKRAIKELKKVNPTTIIDVATGTGDFAIAALQTNAKKITAIDLSVNMLAVGKQKIKALQLEDKIEMIEADSENLPFADNSFDACTVAFGVRNFETLQKGLSQINRVLNNGGTLIVLEFSKPENKIFNIFFSFYFKNILPLIGKLVSKDFSAYKYLYESVQEFPYGKAFEAELIKAGFSSTRCIPLTFGICSIYIGTK